MHIAWCTFSTWIPERRRVERSVRITCSTNIRYFTSGTMFKRVIQEDGIAAQNPDKVRKLVLCSGKVYYDLIKEREKLGLEENIAVTRMEQVRDPQLHPKL